MAKGEGTDVLDGVDPHPFRMWGGRWKKERVGIQRTGGLLKRELKIKEAKGQARGRRRGRTKRQGKGKWIEVQWGKGGERGEGGGV